MPEFSIGMRDLKPRLRGAFCVYPIYFFAFFVWHFVSIA